MAAGGLASRGPGLLREKGFTGALRGSLQLSPAGGLSASLLISLVAYLVNLGVSAAFAVPPSQVPGEPCSLFTGSARSGRIAGGLDFNGSYPHLTTHFLAAFNLHLYLENGSENFSPCFLCVRPCLGPLSLRGLWGPTLRVSGLIQNSAFLRPHCSVALEQICVLTKNMVFVGCRGKPQTRTRFCLFLGPGNSRPFPFRSILF